MGLQGCLLCLLEDGFAQAPNHLPRVFIVAGQDSDAIVVAERFGRFDLVVVSAKRIRSETELALEWVFAEPIAVTRLPKSVQAEGDPLILQATSLAQNDLKRVGAP
jgi:hypothetical protein